MEDQRERKLMKLVNAFLYVKDTQNFNLQTINSEYRSLYPIQILLNGTQRKMKELLSRVQKFQEQNADLMYTTTFQYATEIIKENAAMDENLFNADADEMHIDFEDLKISE